MKRFCSMLAVLALTTLSGSARTLTTISGAVFPDAVVTGVERTGLDIRFRGGTAFLRFDDLPRQELAAYLQTGGGEPVPDATPQQPPAIVAPDDTQDVV